MKRMILMLTFLFLGAVVSFGQSRAMSATVQPPITTPSTPSFMAQKIQERAQLKALYEAYHSMTPMTDAQFNALLNPSAANYSDWVAVRDSYAGQNHPDTPMLNKVVNGINFKMNN